MKPRSNRLLALIAMVVCSVIQLNAQDQSTNAVFGTKDVIPVNVLVGQSKLITFNQPIERFSVSNPDIAEAVLVAGNQVIVNGKAFGQINFIAWEKGTDRFLVFDVYVRTNLSLIDSQIHALFPKDDIRLSQANGSVVISGSVSDPSIATQVDAVVQAAGFKTVNLLQGPFKDAPQVQLQVQVAEVNRSKIRELSAAFAVGIKPGPRASALHSACATSQRTLARLSVPVSAMLRAASSAAAARSPSPRSAKLQASSIQALRRVK